ncbi:hypothetical protein KXR87_19830 [Yokenella regensburgei]|uniref:hypothetical protein n=1 Tax=Yokenella regensburgei TaxID=158877 RepID=UPI003F183D03
MPEFGDFCHIYLPLLIFLPYLKPFLAYSSAIYGCMTFPHNGDANVHIAAIVFFDMLTAADDIPHNISYDKKQGRVNGKGITGERQN